MDRIASVAKIAWFASLFFLIVRYENVPVPFLFGGGLIAIAAARALLDLRSVSFKLTLFDSLFLAYLVLALFYIGFVAPAIWIEDPWNVAFKTAAYGAIYFALRALRATEREAFLGMLIGLVIFSAMFAYAFVLSGMGLNDILNFNYYRVTVQVGAYFNSLSTGEVSNEFSSRDLLRSTMSEGFALSILLFLRARALPPFIVSLFLLLVFQSRRSALSVVAFIALSEVKLWVKLAAVVMGAALLFVLAGTGIVERFTSIASEQRLDMYYIAIEGLTDRSLIGLGYGAKVGTYYVHNFVLASFYMMGLAGLLLSVAIVLALIFDSVRLKSQFAILALVGFAVGSTIEGFMNLSSWAGIALMYNLAYAPSRKSEGGAKADGDKGQREPEKAADRSMLPA